MVGLQWMLVILTILSFFINTDLTARWGVWTLLPKPGFQTLVSCLPHFVTTALVGHWASSRKQDKENIWSQVSENSMARVWAGLWLPFFTVLQALTSVVCLRHPEDSFPLEGEKWLPTSWQSPPFHTQDCPERMRGCFLQPSRKISEFNSDWPILGHVPMPEPITVARGWNSNKGLRYSGSFPSPLSHHGCSQMGEQECWGHITKSPTIGHHLEYHFYLKKRFCKKEL